jgi:ubiquitin-conjugating enzyme E2 C
MAAPAGGDATVATARGPHVAAQRLQRELMELMSGVGGPEDLVGVSAFPADDDLFVWAATLVGPEGTYYAGIEFRLLFKFPVNYPYAPPTVRFATGCYHPNVDVGTGTICLDILQDKWSAVMTASSVLLSLQSLLASPNLQSPLNTTAAHHWLDVDHMRANVAHAAATQRPLA